MAVTAAVMMVAGGQTVTRLKAMAATAGVVPETMPMAAGGTPVRKMADMAMTIPTTIPMAAIVVMI